MHRFVLSPSKLVTELHLYHHQPEQPSHHDLWAGIFHQALPLCLAAAKGLDAPLASLEEIEVSLVSDETITKVHADFLEDATPTDVITFHHGEILISLDTAAEQAKTYGQGYDREVALYIIHGLLHLAGWNDEDPLEQAEMHRLQEGILAEIWPA